jgi:hypothetical protein
LDLPVEKYKDTTFLTKGFFLLPQETDLRLRLIPNNNAARILPWQKPNLAGSHQSNSPTGSTARSNISENLRGERLTPGFRRGGRGTFSAISP